MLKVAKTVIAIPGLLAFVLLVAVLPILLQLGENGSSIRLNWSGGFASIRDYFAGIGTGESFRFLSGRTERSFWEQIGSFFNVSLFYVAAGALIGTTIGILVGIYLGLSRAEWLKRVVEFIGALPDFVIILLLQFLVVYIASETGIVVFRVASLSTDHPAVMLPLISMIVLPANYMIRNVAQQMKMTLSEDYIGFAKARGLGKTYIVFFHALPNVLPFIKADLHKLLGIMMGNLFIVEYLFNMHGVTKLLYADAFAYEGYQYDVVVNGLLSLLAVYAIVFIVLKLFLRGWEKVFVR
ncbi:ABC transporter permease subunit [Cohnella thailandensis]|uniref:ABC transporter permease subunit n=1 Tax=Cohnella thailandensis TaxID=557557 RepID=A0A841T475_9BACL|nr:ABC transporter permease subunit [Cohnella thailandensis]MBB6638422.1 ABC transporter permease subunit [Cohnella thailandensis]MBP1977100.1 peptide/nickel transport system permease protein [Cohnella thailandensis]